MFEHEMEESKQNRVTIEDVQPSVFKALLEFIYTDKVSDLDPVAYELLPVADKYALNRLKTMCETSLFVNLSVETAMNTLLAADLHRAEQLKRQTLAFIGKNPGVMQTEDWKQMTGRPDLLNEVLCQVVGAK